MRRGPIPAHDTLHRSPYRVADLPGLCASAESVAKLIGSIPLAVADNSAASDVWPNLALLDRVWAAHIKELRLIGPPIAIDETPATLDFLRFLRDARTAGLDVDWQGTVSAAIDTRSIAFLAPPTNRSCGAATQWRDLHPSGSLHWHRGPDFVVIMDMRKGDGSYIRHLIEGKRWIETFHALEAPVKRNDLSTGLERRIVAEFDKLGILATAADQLLALPFHEVAGRFSPRT